MNVRAFFEMEKIKENVYYEIEWLNVEKKTTKIGETFIKAITKDYRGQSRFERPLKRYQSSRVKINPDHLNKAAIRCCQKIPYTQ